MLVERGRETHSDAIIVIQDARILVEDYFGKRKGPVYVASAGKSLTALAIGKLLDEGKIQSLDQPVSDFYPEWLQGNKRLYMTLAVASHYNDRICCSLDVVGISNFVTFLQNTETYRRDLRRVEYGDERDPQMREFLTTISPLTNAGKIRKPLFVVQGKNDPRVPYTEAEQIVAEVRKNDTPVWYLMANDEGHGFGKKSNQDFLFSATVLFVNEYLLR